MFPFSKEKGRPGPQTVLIGGDPVEGTRGTFYLEWRENGKRIQRPCGNSPREALDGWVKRSRILDGTIEEEAESHPLTEHLRRSTVGQVRREDILRLFALGREQGLSQGTINGAVMVGLMALHSAGAEISMKKGDWPKVPPTDVVTCEPEEIRSFLGACTPEEWLLFQGSLQSGFRKREGRHPPPEKGFTPPPLASASLQG